MVVDCHQNGIGLTSEFVHSGRAKFVGLFPFMLIKIEGGFGIGGFAVVGRCNLRPGDSPENPVDEIRRCIRVARLRSADESIDDLGQGIDVQP
jgi:hypothetical protein